MPTYRYEAADDRGRSRKGRIDAESAAAARHALRARGLFPLILHEDGAARTGASSWRRLRDTELGWIARQLASLLAAGLPLEECLRAAREQADNAHVAGVLAAVHADVRAGHRLGMAMAAQPRDFPALWRALVDAGEQSGELAGVLDRLAGYMETRGALHNTLLTALIYPVIVLVVSTAIVIFLLSYVVPQVVGAFAQAQQSLPLLTRLLLVVSDGVRTHGWLVLIVLTAGYLLWRLQLRRPVVRLAWHGRLLRLPILGPALRNAEVARFAATLAILTDSRVPLLAALDGARLTLGNRWLQEAVARATAHVREGSALAPALREQGCFPPLLVQLIASGEHTGELPAMLSHAAAVIGGELERRVLRLMALMEPLMILLMGLVVLLIVLAVMLPIIEINQLVL